MALHTPLQIAENVKIRHGNLVESSNEVVELPIIGDEDSRSGVSLEVVHSVLYSRVEETLLLLSNIVEKSGLKEQMGAGIILTGGMTKLKGIRELAQAIFSDMSVRVGYPASVQGLFDELKDPSFSTAIGLLLYQADSNTQYEINFNKELLHSKEKYPDSLDDLKIGQETYPDNKATPSETSGTQNEPSDTTKSENIIFNKLPDMAKGKKNSLKKLGNWAKQLF